MENFPYAKYKGVSNNRNAFFYLSALQIGGNGNPKLQTKTSF